MDVIEDEGGKDVELVVLALPLAVDAISDVVEALTLPVEIGSPDMLPVDVIEATVTLPVFATALAEIP